MGDLSTQFDSVISTCKRCGILLPEPEYVRADNVDASVGCECRCGCSDWYCWACAQYTVNDDEDDTQDPWFCVPCVRNCVEV